MKTRNYGLYAVAIAIVAVGALWAGLPLVTLGFLAVCPLMMFFMMRGMRGGGMGGMRGGGERDNGAEKSSDPAERAATHDHGRMR